MKKKIIFLLVFIISIFGITLNIYGSDNEQTYGSFSCEVVNPIYRNENIYYNYTINSRKNTVVQSTKNSIEYLENENLIAAQIRDNMVNRTNQFTVYAKIILDKQITNEIFNTYTGNLVTKAISEELSTSSSSGDYLKWSWNSYNVGAYYNLETVNDTYIYNLNITYNFLYYTTYDQESILNKDIKEYIDLNIDKQNDSDYQKICKVYDFICNRVTYDYDNLEDENYKLKYTAYAALENKTAVCQGYATLFYKILKESGMENIRIMTSNTHAWNIVKIGNIYYNLDSTWDAGKSPYKYFLKGSNNFTETDHIRSEEYLTEEFESKYPTSSQDYLLTPVYSINRCSLDDFDNYTYTGNEIKPIITDINYGLLKLTESEDYDLKYFNNINVGTAIIQIIGKENGRYIGVINKSFIIKPLSINNFDINIECDSYEYDGNYKTPNVYIDGLEKNKDYTIKYESNYYPGIAKAIITGIGNYTGTREINFEIKQGTYKEPIEIANLNISSVSNQTYTGKYIIPNITIKDNNVTLIKNIDYTVQYKNNLYPGIAEIIITGIGDYKGTVTKKFMINPSKLVNVVASKNATNKVKISWTKQPGVSGYRICKYNFKTKKYEYLKQFGSSTTYCYIDKLSAGNEYRFKMRSYKNTNSGTLYGSYSNIVYTATLPNKVTISRIKAGTKKLTVKWKSVSAGTGYVIEYSTSSKFRSSNTKKVTINSRTTASKTIYKLKRRQKYYVRIRAYKTVNNKRYYSSYSKYVYVKVR